MTRDAQDRLRQTLEIAGKSLALAIAFATAACSSSAPATPSPPSPPAGEVWTMYRGDLARDGHPPSATLDANSAGRLGLSWKAHLEGAVDGTPVVAGGMVIAGSAGGDLVALDAGTGLPVWSKHGLGAIAGSPAIADGRVFVGTLTSRGYAFRLSDGAAIWTWRGPGDASLWASPVAYMDEVILGVASPYGDSPLVAGRLVAVDAATGRERWNVCVRTGCGPGDGIWSTPAIDQRGVAFVGVGNPDDGVLAFDALTGARKWFRSLYADAGRDLDVGATPVVFAQRGREVIGLGSDGGTFAVFDASGAPAWSREIVVGSAVHGLIASPASDGANIYAGSASPPLGMFALNPSDGTTVWRHGTDQPVYSAPSVGNGVLIFGTGPVFGALDAGSIVALSTAGGDVLWSYDTHSPVRSGPALAGDLVVVGDYSGDVFAFRPRF